MRHVFLLMLAAWPVAAQTFQAPETDPAYAPLAKAYDALRTRQYDEAVANFEKAIQAAPARAAIRKDLAYTLLKIGETESARDQFKEAMRIDPQDTHVALEYAFLCYETKQRAEARRIFLRVKDSGDAASRATAQQAFDNIDRPLVEGIERWKKALEISPANFSAHQELAQLAEERDEPALAAEHYEAAWRLRADLRELLLDLGRTWKAAGREPDANAALLAASRGAQARVAERARALSPERYPYVYEFRKALELDPKNIDLRRELAYLLLEMKDRAAAEGEFQSIVASAPDDLLSAAQLGFLRLARNDAAAAQPLFDRVLEKGDAELIDRVRAALNMPRSFQSREAESSRRAREAKEMGVKSLSAGYLKDALKYLSIAHESDPVDFDVMLKLGWTYNVLKQDRQALRWFDLARKSPDQQVSQEASKAYRNLAPGLAHIRTTVWMFPMFSTRWHDLFAYSQAKVEFKLGDLPFRPYLSMRFVGDTRQTLNSGMGMLPQYLSESSFIAGAGIATRNWHGLLGWFEAGEAMKYLGSRTDVGAMIPDYRGGLAFARGFGRLLGRGAGLFHEFNADGLFVSRFNNDMLLYLQNRTGYTLPSGETSGFQAQVYWNYNLTADRKGEYWANYFETGPGIKLRIKPMPANMALTVNAMRGNYLIREGNPRGPVFFDLRVGIWYALTR